MSRAPRPGGLALAGAFGAVVSLVSLGKAFHLDEAFFLAVARQILRDPADPLGFLYNWTGWTLPANGVYVHSTFTPYMLAAGLKLAGWNEVLLRLAFVPFDALSAMALYALSARFLKRPLWPVLCVLASPYWVLPVPMLIAERWIVLCALGGLWALVEGLERKAAELEALAVALLSLAVVIKLSAAFALAPAAYLAWRARKPGLAAALALLPAAAAGADLWWLEPGRRGATAAILAGGPSWLERVHHVRALLAFTGGLGLSALLWPAFGAGRFAPGRLAAAALGAALFLPALDLAGMTPGPLDRASGALFAAAAAYGAASLRGGFWTSWAAAGAALALVNWSISARACLLFLPALTLGLAARLEEERSASRIMMPSFALLLFASLCLSWADARYADAQRTFAAAVKGAYGDRTLRFTGHWGLQHYLEDAGAVSLDEGRGGWAEAKKGDAVVIPGANALVQPPRGVRCDLRSIVVDSALPVRVIRLRASQAGFYSDAWGFLPYAFTREPVDLFTVCLVL